MGIDGLGRGQGCSPSSPACSGTAGGAACGWTRNARDRADLQAPWPAFDSAAPSPKRLERLPAGLERVARTTRPRTTRKHARNLAARVEEYQQLRYQGDRRHAPRPRLDRSGRIPTAPCRPVGLTGRGISIRPIRRSRPSRIVNGCGGQPGMKRSTGTMAAAPPATRPRPGVRPPEMAQAPTAMTIARIGDRVRRSCAAPAPCSARRDP